MLAIKSFILKEFKMFSYADALEIATTAHSGQADKSGGSYISYLQSIANQLQANGEPELVLITALLQDIMGEATGYTPAKLSELGVPPEIIDIISILTHQKNQTFIDDYSCKRMAEGVPAEDATYEAREKEYLRYIDKVKENINAKKVKIVTLKTLLKEDLITKNERREKKNKFRIKKYENALKSLEE